MRPKDFSKFLLLLPIIALVLVPAYAQLNGTDPIPDPIPNATSEQLRTWWEGNNTGLYDSIPSPNTPPIIYNNTEFVPFTYRGDNFIANTTDGNIVTWKSAPTLVATDEVNNMGRTIYKEYLYSDNPTYVKVEAGDAGFVFDKLTCAAQIYKSGRYQDTTNRVVESDSYVPKTSITGQNDFQIINSLNDATCQTGVITNSTTIEVYGLKHTDNVGDFKIRYIKSVGEPLKTQIEVTNLSNATDREYGLTQTIHVPSTITWLGAQIDLNNYVGQTFNRTILDDNKVLNSANLLKLTDDFDFNVIDAWDSLDSIVINSVNGTASISLNYFYNATVILPGETLIIDPTYGYSTGTIYNSVKNSDAGQDCTGTFSSFNAKTSGSTGRVYKTGGAGAGICEVMVLYWDISTIPDNATITDTDVRIDNPTSSVPHNCQWHSIETDPSDVGSSAEDIWNDIYDGSNLVASPTDLCKVIGENELADITLADSDVEANLGDDWWAVGLRFDVQTRPGHPTRYSDFNDPELQVQYTLPCTPNAPTGQNATPLNTTSILISWSAPVNCANITTELQYTDGQSAWSTIYSSTPKTNHTQTGLEVNEDYFYRVRYQSDDALWGAYSANATTWTSPNPPVSLSVVPTSTTQLDLTWGTQPFVDVLVVAGGAGGGGGLASVGACGRGGGGGGGVMEVIDHAVLVQNYGITIGSGGIGSNNNGNGGVGGSSTFDTITSVSGSGGGGGASGAGGAGGGGGAGNGGAGGCGGSAGSNGEQNDFRTGSDVYYSGGGGGGGNAGGNAGGAGGGGTGTDGHIQGGAGGTNTGGGGGGTNYTQKGGDGGSGIIVIRYISGTMIATGGIETSYGPYNVHTFTSSGSFNITTFDTPALPDLDPDVDFLIVGGGGGGGGAGFDYEAGGGGHGGFFNGTNHTISVQNYSIVVGSGGSSGGQGSPSSFDSMVSEGGDSALHGPDVGGGGSSGGIDGSRGNDPTKAGGGGNQYAAGGGGGAGGAGIAAVKCCPPAASVPGIGGTGVESDIRGTGSVYYAAGGGGGNRFGAGGAGGQGGGGAGGSSGGAGVAGTANTGSGGGGCGAAFCSNGGTGGTGIVIIRYLSGAMTAIGGVETFVGNYTVHTFLSSGNFNVTSIGSEENVTYNVERLDHTVACTGDSTWSTIITGVNITEYNDTTTTNECKEYRVRAANPGGTSEPTNTDYNATFPSAPINVQANGDGPTSILVSWDNIGFGANGHKIERELPSPNTSVLLIGGGGGGAGGVCNVNLVGRGGGGAGGWLAEPSHVVTVQNYVVTVAGGGGGGGGGCHNAGGTGGTTTFDTLTATGGGGGLPLSGGAGSAGGSGGSGSGGGGYPWCGGGGAGQNGQCGSGNGKGGNGIQNDYRTGSLVYYSGGGGSGGNGVHNPSGGAGGGGTGGDGGNGGAGGANTGGGGGGTNLVYSGGSGGSGIVVIRYLTGGLTATGGIETSYDAYTVHTFTSTGSFNVTSVASGFETLVNNTFTPTTEYVDDGLTVDTIYTYRVSTHNESGVISPVSAEASGTPLAASGTINNMIATFDSYNITLNTSDDIAIGYDIVRDNIPFTNNGTSANFGSTLIDPISYIRFDDLLTDPLDYGSRDSGTATTTGALDYRTSPLGHSAYFDGTNDYINLNNESDFDFERTDPFSVSLWVYPTADGQLVNKRIQTGDQQGWEFYLASTKPVVRIRADNSPQNDITVLVNAGLTYGEWIHMAMTYDGSSLGSGVQIYVNGIAQVKNITNDNLSVTILNNEDVFIGSWNDFSDKITGTIDDVRIYDTELSSGQITEIYNKQYLSKWKYPSIGSIADNVIAYWDFDNTLFDKTVNGNDWNLFSGGETYIDGTFGRSVVLNNYEYRNTGLDDNFDLHVNDDWSVAFRYQMNDASGSEYLLSKGDSTAGGWNFYTTLDGKFGLYLHSAGGDYIICRTGTGFDDGVMRDYIFTHSSTGGDDCDSVTMYINGVETTTDDTEAGTLVNSNTNQVLTLGARTGGSFPVTTDNELDMLMITSDVMTQGEVWAFGNMTGYTESDIVFVYDNDVTPPFAYNYTNYAIDSTGITQGNTVFSAPAPDDIDISNMTMSIVGTDITITVDQEQECYGTCHGYYVDKYNSTYSIYVPQPFDVPPPNYYWKFDGKETGRLNYGTFDLNPLDNIDTEKYGDGQIGSGLLFDGDDYYSVDGSFNFLDYTSPWSVTWSQYLTADTENQYVFSKGGETVTDQAVAVHFDLDEKMRAYIQLDNTKYLYCLYDTSSELGSWANYAVTYNGSNSCSGFTVYINGVEESLDTDSSVGVIDSTVVTNNPMIIGERWDYGGNELQDGTLLDELKFWNEELTSSQVTSIDNLVLAINSNPYDYELIQLKFNDNPYDSAHGYNPKVTGTPIYASGIINNAIDFVDNTLIDLEIYDDEFPFRDYNEAKSYAFWFNGAEDGATQTLFHDYDTIGSFLQLRTDGKIRFEERVVNPTNHLEIQTDSDVSDGTYKHFVLTLDGTGSCAGTNMYIDSVSQGLTCNKDTLSSSVDNTASFLIGSAGSSESYDSEMDDFRYYEFELSQGQIDEIYNSGNGTENPLGATPLSAPFNFTDTSDKIAGIYYNYTIYPVNGAGQAGGSPALSQLTFIPPDPPANVTAISVDPTPLNVQLNWDQSTDLGSNTVLTGYTIEISEGGGPFIFLDVVTPITTTNYIDNGKIKDTDYVYKFYTNGDIVNGSGTAFSQANVTTLDGPSISPFIEALPKIGNESVQLNWATPVDDGGSAIIGYKVEMQTNGGGYATLVNNTFSTSTTGVLNSLSANNTYDARVSAWNGVDNGPANTTTVEMSAGSLDVVNIGGGGTIGVSPTLSLTYGIPDTLVTKLEFYRNNELQTTFFPNQVIPKGGDFTFSTFFDYPEGLEEIRPGDYNYFVIAYTTNGEPGQETLFTSPEITFSTVLLASGSYGLTEQRNEFYNVSIAEFVAVPANYSVVLVYREANSFDPPTFYAYDNVIVNVTQNVDVDPSLRYYITAYKNPTFDYVVGSPYGSPTTATIPIGYPVTGSTVSNPSPFAQQGIGIDTIAGESGLFGLPIVFIFIIVLASVFTGRSAPMGIIFVAVAIGIMVYMGLISFEFDVANQSNIATWAIIIVAVIIGVMVGKRWD